MNITKIICVLAFATCAMGLEALPAKTKSTRTQPPLASQDQTPWGGGISREQIEQMQELEQFIQALVTSLMVAFIKKYPKFIQSLIVAYEKDAALVEQKVVTHVERYIKEQGDQAINAVLQEVNADKEAYEMVQQIKPFVENILAVEVVKWIHITALSGLTVATSSK